MPLFSVIIPVWNRPDLLKRAVDSVEGQTLSDWECHIIDDGSSTEHPYFRESSPHTSSPGKTYYRYFSSNRGVSWARNEGFRRSRGEWIAFLDSDDEWLPEKLSAAKDFIVQHPELKIFQTGETWIRGGRRVNPPAHLRKQGGDLFRESLERCMITTSSAVLHRSLLEAFPWDEELPACEDYDLWIRITSRHPVGLLPTPLTIRYQDYGGEQLSKRYPVMDRFRIHALEKFIRSEGKGEKTDRAEEVREKKLRIVLNGARKRGR